MRVPAALIVTFACLTGCGESADAPRVTLPVVVEASPVAEVTTDLGYAVQVSSVRLAVSDLQMTTAGEVHTSLPSSGGQLWASLWDTLVPSAHAHPGHYQGGVVTGELLGEFIVEWPGASDGVLGDATLISGTYSAANFGFRAARADELPADDPLIGHAAIVAGVARRDGGETPFTFVLDAPEGRELVGAPFEARIGAGSVGELRFVFDPNDALEGDTLFDGVAFADLAGDASELRVTVDDPDLEDAYNDVRRAFLSHDHYRLKHHE